MTKRILAGGLGVFGAVLVLLISAGSRGDSLLIAVEMLASNDRVIPLAYDHGDYHCLHVKPPELLLRNISGGEVTLTRATLIGRSGGSEVARFTVDEDQIRELMPAQNRRMNEYQAARHDSQAAYRFGRIHGQPTNMTAAYHEGHELPPSAHACLGLDAALYFFYQGVVRLDALEVVIDARDSRGRSSSVTMALPYQEYNCKGEYQFPVQGACTIGSLPIGQNHRFGNGQEFALDILDLRRLEDGSFSTSGLPSPMVLMGSDQVADYHLYGRPVRSMADGIVIGVEVGYPDAFAANPQESPGKRKERFKEHWIAQGEDPDDLPGANYVFIDHGQGEYARYCHLREEVPVRVGDHVKRGDVIGYVGNSGQSMEPHLHLELLDSPDYRIANGLPIVFDNLDLASALDSPGFRAMNSFVFSEFIFVISD